jgi:hypothetical protein
VSLSTRDVDCSTWANRTPEKAMRRYVSVDHALNWLLHFAHPSALDCEALAAPGRTSPDPDSFIVDQGEQAVLAIAFNDALAAVGDERATIWARVRLHHDTHRSFDGHSKTQVGRIVGEVEGQIAQELKDLGRWVTGQIRSKDEVRTPAAQEVR